MKVYYDLDPYNRLIVKKGRSRLKQFRQVCSGTFKTDKKNRLFYEVSKSSGISIPQKIKFSGIYSLDKRHNLIFTLNKWNNQCQGNRLRLDAKLISASKNEIVFLLNAVPSGTTDTRHKYTMKLHGSWQVDKNNRLRFGVKKEDSRIDELTLYNAWNLNKNNEIIYSYARSSHVITLKGDWHIKERYRLGYILDKNINSGFNFRSSLGQVIPRSKKTYVKFDVAIDISKRKRVTRSIIFTCRSRLQDNKIIIVELSPGRGPSFRLTKEILNKKGMLYLESFIRDNERYFGGGIGFRW
ncbi:MAG: hypothetical protein KJ957_06245 [Candidatus Omnitrophica bacterium]|nr:hypothetical protein [Candidatus Omnitrophota bacterium]